MKKIYSCLFMLILLVLSAQVNGQVINFSGDTVLAPGEITSIFLEYDSQGLTDSVIAFEGNITTSGDLSFLGFTAASPFNTMTNTTSNVGGDTPLPGVSATSIIPLGTAMFQANSPFMSGLANANFDFQFTSEFIVDSASTTINFTPESSVPEPSSGVLLALASLCFGMKRKRIVS